MKKTTLLISSLVCGHVFAAANPVDGVWQINNGNHKGSDIITTMVVDTSKNTSAMCPHDASTIVVSKLKQEGGKVIAINPTFGVENTLTVKGDTLVLSNGDKWKKATAADVNKVCISALNAKGFLTQK